MPFHVRDTETDTLVRELARAKGIGLTEAVKLAVRNELKRDSEATPLHDRLREIAASYGTYPASGDAADKKFFDDLSGD